VSGDFLAEMAASSRARCAAASAKVPGEALLARAEATPMPSRLQLSALGFDVIAEVKLRSPAVGQLQGPAEDLGARVTEYAAAGAAAVSVLTEPSRFDGSLEHLQLTVAALAGRIPAMRKDFIVDPYQVIEARVAGAGGVLAILRMLPPSDTAAIIDTATRLGLFVLLEAFDAADLALATQLLRTHQPRALAAGAPLLVGVNCRDLATLQVVPGQLAALVSAMPVSAPRVAESGVESATDAARLATVGYSLALVGSALMKHARPAELLGDMLHAGRDAAAARGPLS
jgi:indole-3-glycerol phosphate synthase